MQRAARLARSHAGGPDPRSSDRSVERVGLPPWEQSGLRCSGSRQHRRVAATRRSLLAAARSVFAEKGLDLTTIDDIAERADLGKGTLYYHFKGKPRLVRELINEVLGDLVEAVESRCNGATDVADLLDRLIGAHIEFFCTRWEDFVLCFNGRSDLTLTEGYPGIGTPYVRYLESLEQLASVLSYKVPPPALRRIVCAVVGFVSGYYSFATIASEGDDLDETFRSLRGAMVASLVRFIQEAAPPPSGGQTSLPQPTG